jgi:hypothetical protein
LLNVYVYDPENGFPPIPAIEKIAPAREMPGKCITKSNAAQCFGFFYNLRPFSRPGGRAR